MKSIERLIFLYHRFISRFFNKFSLKGKISKDIVKGMITIFVLTYIPFFLIHYFFIKEHLLFNSIGYLILLVVIFIYVDYILLKSIKKNILNRFEDIKNDMDEIKKGNVSKRITIDCTDEIGKMTYFTNSLLEQLEKFVEYEKNYSLIDPLTSCYNRRAFEINFNSLLEKTKRKNNHFCLAYIDIDHFKKFNDKYGHKVGDDVLISFVEIIKQHIRQYDSLYRMGGEEFVLILDDINKINAKARLEKLRKNIPYLIKKQVNGITDDVTISIGFAISGNYDLENPHIIEQMLEDTDKLLYKCKETGRNKILSHNV